MADNWTPELPPSPLMPEGEPIDISSDVERLTKGGLQERFAKPMAAVMHGLRQAGFDPVAKQMGRSAEDATLNYIRGTSDRLARDKKGRLSGSEHLVGLGVDLRDKNLGFDVNSPEGQRYVREYHRLRAMHGLSPASTKDPAFDAHHTEMRERTSKGSAGQKVLDYLNSVGVTEDEIANLRATLASERPQVKDSEWAAHRDKRGRELLNELIESKRKPPPPAPSASITGPVHQWLASRMPSLPAVQTNTVTDKEYKLIG